MRKSNKKGFTIVELVIVIAIIAILAAVLIPTFAGLIQKANESKDTQLVKNLNTALAADNKEHKTMTSALEAAAAFGYDVGKINASATGKEILWDSENDVFCYYDNASAKPQYIPETTLKNSNVATYKLWKIYTEAPTTQTFSIYWNSDANFAQTLTVGFDAGNNTAITALKYERTTGATQDVVIRTKGGTLTINAGSDTVQHYGVVEKTIINNIYTESYHEFGYVTSYIQVDQGHVVIESGASVSIVAVNGGSVTLEQKSGSELFKVRPVGDVRIDTSKIKVDNAKIDNTAITGTEALAQMKYGGGNGTDGSPYELYTASHLVAFANDVNNGVYNNYIYAKLCADVDISGMGWKPIGNAEHPFFGSFTGAKNTEGTESYTVKGLTNKGYEPSYKLFGVTSNSNNAGTAYGFFGVVGLKQNPNGTPTEIELKNINFTNVNIDTDNANMLGVLLGADVAAAKTVEGYVNPEYAGNLTVQNITTQGKIVSTNKSGVTVGGVVGKLYAQGNLTFTNCSNKCDISASGNSKAAGVVGFISFANNPSQISRKFSIIECSNSGTIKTTESSGYVAGIFSYGTNTGINSNTGNSIFEVKNNTNSGDIYNKNTNTNYIGTFCSLPSSDNISGNTNSGKIYAWDEGSNSYKEYTSYNFGDNGQHNKFN